MPSRKSQASRSTGNDDSSSTFSGTSSSYRHHHAGSFLAASPDPPQPVLVRDTQHTPKTTGSLGIMIVGLGGANGTVLLAGALAHRLQVEWYGPRGEPKQQPHLYGCITQLDQKGGGVGFRNRVKGLADVSMAAIGGWDIRPDLPGDALLRDQILDYDLVRQVRDDMNQTKVFRGLYDPRFIGSSQHPTATHILTESEAPNDAEALKCLRADIRYFKWRNGVVGHTTVIWSASVEPNSDLVPRLTTANALLDAISCTEDERGGPLPPSLLYATAAILEGCSFINGGSQNTLACPGLNDLARQQERGVYCLGTDFKAGQTKFKTAAVEYIRTMGLLPKVIASSNHLGNNDMKNLATSKATSTAKLRVKHDIFAPWEEDELDHKVSIMYTPYINDEKRDFVEYTSLGFLGHTHTMVTYTRASDSVLCVPLMIDGAVWCDYFARASWPLDKVATALAYLFKVPEGAAKGVDPGFFHQMKILEQEVLAADRQQQSAVAGRRVRIRDADKHTEWAIPHDARIICGGLACVDMQLNEATGGDGGENIESFEGETSIGGGSVSMACKTLARLCHGAPLDEGTYMQVTPPVVHTVVPLCKIGCDATGDTLMGWLEQCGQACRNVVTQYTRRCRDPQGRTALAVLPIYKDGRRGCFFDAASNVTFSAQDMMAMMHSLCPGSTGPSLDMSQLSKEDVALYTADLEQMTPTYGAFLFGYPHLLPGIQGEALADVFIQARRMMIDGGIVALDLNGVPEEAAGSLNSNSSEPRTDLRNDPVIGAALEHVDILHMNEDELCYIAGCKLSGRELEDDYTLATAIDAFLLSGVAVVVVTRGSKGSFVRCNDEQRFSQSPMLPASWVDCNAKIGCSELPEGTILNTNGAGDAFTAGFLVASMLRHTGMTVIEDPASPRSQSSEPPPPPQAFSPPPSKKKLTPYSLYMREHYVTLRAQLNDDKKAIFSKCHEMWEEEDDTVRALYERRAHEENTRDQMQEEDPTSRLANVALETLDSTTNVVAVSSPRNLYMTNRSLNLESAVQLASLIAAYHIDMSTRDRTHLDLGQLLERAMVVSSQLEEI